jgi:hypothetical protein
MVGIGVGSLLMLKLCQGLALNPLPPFARDVTALTADKLWVVGLFALYWPINILGQNLVWRGILLSP